MATVFMRWLERRPALYARGIRLLTLGQLDALYDIILDQIEPGQRVLEIGCGTGALTARMAERADQIEAIDVSVDMLEAARHQLEEHGLQSHVQLTQMDALALESVFSPKTFDRIVSSLTFSELSYPAQEHLLRICQRLLRSDGTLWLLDEIRPSSPGRRFVTMLIRRPLKLITWLLTRTTTQPLSNVEQAFHRAGFTPECIAAKGASSLALYRAKPKPGFNPLESLKHTRQLRHKVNWRTRLLDAWALFFRVLPPYPQFEPGLYAVGKPDRDAPVLVTGNYELTVRRVLRSTAGISDAWLLVVDSAGINVWCGAGGGFLTAERVLGALAMSGLHNWHKGKHLILPQLCANGVDGNLIREQTGWEVSWGPVRAEDIPAYLSNAGRKTEAMRTVRFPLRDRLEMVSATLGLYGLLILIPVLIFWREQFWAVLIALLGLSFFYALALPLIPGKDGLLKSVPLAGIALAGMFAFSWFSGSMEPFLLFRRGIAMVALSVFVAAELQGMSPLMRGEQANWGWEALIAVILGGLYWLVPRWVGWSS